MGLQYFWFLDIGTTPSTFRDEVSYIAKKFALGLEGDRRVLCRGQLQQPARRERVRIFRSLSMAREG